MAKVPASRLIKQGDDLSPDFYLSISGKDAGKATSLWDAVRPYVTGITYEEDEEMASLLEITLINKSRDVFGQPSVFNEILNSKAFQEGNFIDLWIGYGGALEYMGRTEIVKWLPAFPADGPVTFTIKGYDGRHKMMKSNQYTVKQSGKNRKRKTAYRDVLDDEIVKMVARKYGYGVSTDKPKIKRTTKKGGAAVARIQPSDMNDWDFLRKLAAINRFDLWVEYSLSKKQFIINFKERKDAGSAIFKFEYNIGMGSLLEAEPDFSIQDQPTDVEVLFFDRRKRTIERTLISDSTKGENVKLTSAGVDNLSVKKEVSRGASVRFTAFGQQIEAFTDKPFNSKNEATTFVQNWLSDREQDFLLLKGKTIGVETLRPRQIHQFVGMNTRVDGVYRLKQVKHVLIPGNIYHCEILGNKVLSQEIARRKPTTTVKKKATNQNA